MIYVQSMVHADQLVGNSFDIKGSGLPFKWHLLICTFWQGCCNFICHELMLCFSMSSGCCYIKLLIFNVIYNQQIHICFWENRANAIVRRWCEILFSSHGISFLARVQFLFPKWQIIKALVRFPINTDLLEMLLL